MKDVLDDFNKPKQPAKTKEAVTSTTTEPSNNPESNNDAAADFDENDFLKQLEADMMSKLMAAGIDSPNTAPGPSSSTDAATGFDSKQVDELEKQFGDAGINPEDFFKELLAEAMQKPPAPSSSMGKDVSSSSAAKATTSAGENNNTTDEKGSFQDTIQRTLERMQESGDKATAATTEDGDISNDLLEQLLKAMDGAGDGESTDMNQMFMGMMQQLSNKEMLYEPMKELHTKFGPWLQENRDKVPADELERYETQARLVGEIVNKFDEADFSDDKPDCRSYIWERMQAVRLHTRHTFYMTFKLTIDIDASSRKPARRPHCKPVTRRTCRWQRRGS
jgi:peroxin-19